MLFFSRLNFADLGAKLPRIFIWALLTLIVSACSFTPVYSNAEGNERTFNLSYASANSRLEQIVYSGLAASIPNSKMGDEFLVEIIVTSSAIEPGTGSVGLTGNITLTNITTSNIVFSGTRTASATFVSSGQSLANQQAANEASERAALQLSQTIRLTLIGILSAQP